MTMIDEKNQQNNFISERNDDDVSLPETEGYAVSTSKERVPPVSEEVYDQVDQKVSNSIQDNSSQNDMSDEVSEKIHFFGAFMTKMLIGLLSLSLILSVVLYIQNSGNEKKLVLEKEKVKNLQSEVLEFGKDRVVASRSSLEAIQMIEKEEIKWSFVLDSLDKLIPKERNGRDKINVLSYNASEGGRISLSFVSNPAVEPPFNDVAQLISVFSGNLYFKDVFVPSISRTRNQQGREVLSFMMTVNYEPPDLNIPIPESLNES